MSKTGEKQTKKPKKKAALGRGLGSLLGEPVEQPAEIDLSDDDFSFGSAEPPLKESFKDALKRETTNATLNTTSATKTTANAEKPAPTTPNNLRIWNVSIEELKGNLEQPRKIFEDEALLELSNSIKEKGILQPIVARKLDNGKYEIIAGERRWRAAQKAGLQEVPVILKEVNDQDSLELALIENIQRQDLNPIEEAEAYSFLVKKYNMTQQQVADKVGKERATIANTLRLLQLAPEVREYVSGGQLSLGLAKVLIPITDATVQKKLAKKFIANAVSVRAAEKIVKQVKEQGLTKTKIEEIDVSKKLAESLSQELQKAMGTKVNIDYSKGKGKLTIKFYSDDQLNNLVDRIRGAWQN